ncbi:MAG TPA: adenosylcobinamide-GDP ribazoletransferase [Gemmatimonadaceae bacterium]
MGHVARGERKAGGVAAWLRGLSAAVSFLTRIPSHRIIAHDGGDLTNATAFFPIVGLLVGLCGALMFAGASLLWSPALAAILSVAFTVWLTGAFHEDALADSFDGFGGGWNTEQVLSIMKDSRVGSYALVGVALVLGAKIGAIVALADASRPVDAAAWFSVMTVGQSLIAAHMLGRWSSVLLMHTTNYVRVAQPGARPSAGGPFAGRASSSATTTATVLTLAVVGALLRRQAIVVILVAALVTWIGRRYFVRRIGGITGDALGAANQFVELAVYLTLAAHWPN